MGDYICTKAITKIEEQFYVAWFSEEIPIPLGPGTFYGLPGLIFMVELGKENTIYMKNCTFNTIKSLELTPPTDGIVMSRGDFELLQKQKEEDKAVKAAEDFFND